MDYHHPFDDPIDHLQFFSSVASTFASPTKKVASQCVVVDCLRGSVFSCPHCKLSYCSRHAGSPLMMAKIVNDETGYFDPLRGDFKRICVYCYWEKRPGYSFEDFSSPKTCNHLDAFVKKRSEAVDKLELNINRVERRLQKLSEYKTENKGLMIGAVGFREYCQRLIPWDPNESTDKCPLCKSEFNALLSRKHHCRLCGGLLCASCSTFIPLRVMVWDEKEQSQTGSNTINIRACSKCNNLLFKYTSNRP